jgi:hypothetical protein
MAAPSQNFFPKIVLVPVFAARWQHHLKNFFSKFVLVPIFADRGQHHLKISFRDLF